ncbi:MAG: ChaB family protein [Candidatus Helarchaeota archaeon]
MSDNSNQGIFINYLLSMLLKKITVPGDYHSQVKVVKEMLADDVSGLVDSLTDFAVNSASVDFKIETSNDNFTKILKHWVDTINLEYNQIPTGLSPLAKEYFKERWKGSSFPILKIGGWTAKNNVILPTKLFFVDGASIYAEDLNVEDKTLKLINYEYYLGKNKLKNNKLDKAIITKPYSRWYDKYPTPYLIKRGVYHNWKIIKSIKDKETEILDQIIPYLLLIKKGTEGLAVNDIKNYSNDELQGVIKQFQELMDEIKGTDLPNKLVKSPIRATNFDEEIKHLIPDLSTIFNRELFEVAERNILSGLGFIDVVEATSTSRRESVLNPKAFIEEVKAGVSDFKQIIKELVYKIIEKNSSHIKYINSDFYVCSSPVRGFMTDNFKRQIQRLWRSGRLSDQTAVELVAEVDFETEVMRRKRETKRGLETVLYPPVAENREDKGLDIKNLNPDKETTPDKEDPIEREEYNIGEEEDLVTAPYKEIKELPDKIKNSMTKSLQKVWLKVFNSSYKKYHNDSKAASVAWEVITKIAEKNKDNKWVKKSYQTKQVKSDVEDILKAVLQIKNIELAEKKELLLDRLLNNEK